MSSSVTVIELDNFMDGDWTHSEVTTAGLHMLLEEMLQEYEDSNQSPYQFVRNINPRVIEMDKDEFERIPEV